MVQFNQPKRVWLSLQCMSTGKNKAIPSIINKPRSQGLHSHSNNPPPTRFVPKLSKSSRLTFQSGMYEKDIAFHLLSNCPPTCCNLWWGQFKFRILFQWYILNLQRFLFSFYWNFTSLPFLSGVNWNQYAHNSELNWKEFLLSFLGEKNAIRIESRDWMLYWIINLVECGNNLTDRW